MQIEIYAKPLTVNRVWAGRRFKTPAYKAYEIEIGYLLTKEEMIKGFVEIRYDFYIKNFGLSDVDNLIKPIQDIIVKKGYIEDDRKIKKITAEKHKSEVNKIRIEIKHYESITKKNT